MRALLFTSLIGLNAFGLGTLTQSFPQAAPSSGGGSSLATPVSIANGGTGQATAQAAIDALLPTQTSNSGKFLTTNGTTSSWGSQTTAVTSVGTIGGSIANGGSVSGAVLTLGTADGTNPGLVTTGTQTIAGAKTFSSTMADTIASGSIAYQIIAGSYVALDASRGTSGSLIRDDSFGTLILTGRGATTISGGVGAIALNTSNNGTIVDNNSNNKITLKGSNTGTDTSIAAGGGHNAGINIAPDGSGTITNNGDPIPALHHTQSTAQQSEEWGDATLSSGSVVVTYATAFSAAPVCTCNEVAAAPIACGPTATPGTSSVTFAVATGGSNHVQWRCAGAR